MPDLTIIGVDHGSPRSSSVVRATISEQSPDTVFIELDDRRLSNIDPLRDRQRLPLPIRTMDMKDWGMYRVMKARDNISAAVRLFMYAAEERKLPERIPGPEETATVEAHKSSATVVPIDKDFTRDVQLTEFLTDVSVEVKDVVEKHPGDITESDRKLLNRELSVLMPSVVRERDGHMAGRINDSLSGDEEAVAVMGMVHAEGVKSRLDEHISVTVVS